MKVRVARSSSAALAFSFAAALAAPSAFAQNQQPSPQPDGQLKPQQGQAQSLEQVKQARQSEADRQGGRMIQVREKAVWGLSDVAQERIFSAMKHLVEEPDKAEKDLMVLADVIELQASLGGQEGQQRGAQAAEPIRDASQRVRYKQLVTKQELQRTLGQAALSLAQVQFQGARQGVERQDQEQTGYPLTSAATFLGIAHTLLDRQPATDVSRAIYDAETLGKQIVKLSQPTTGQGAQQTAGRNGDGTGDLANTARQAGGRIGGEGAAANAMPAEARRVVEQFGQALQQSRTSLQPQGGQQQQEGPARQAQ